MPCPDCVEAIPRAIVAGTRALTMRVQVHYVEGCPNWTVAEGRLRQALDQVGESAAVEHCLVETQEEAERLGFGGSPSILLNGRDAFDALPGAVGLACRIYSTPDGPRGSPTLDQIVSAIRAQVRSA
jgi:hypothetical protein